MIGAKLVAQVAEANGLAKPLARAVIRQVLEAVHADLEATVATYAEIGDREMESAARKIACRWAFGIQRVIGGPSLVV